MKNIKLIGFVFVQFAAIGLSACSDDDEGIIPDFPVIDDNPGRDIAIPHSIVEHTRIKGIRNYFDLVYDAEGWLQSGTTVAGVIEVEGKLEKVKLSETYYLGFSECQFGEIKRNAHGYITSTKVTGKTEFSSFNANYRFSYDQDERVDTVRYLSTAFVYSANDTIAFSDSSIYSFSYSDNTIQKITYNWSILDSRTGEPRTGKKLWVYSGEPVENRYCVYDLYSARLITPPLSILCMSGYLGKWARYIPQNLTEYEYDSSLSQDIQPFVTEVDLDLRADSDGKLIYSYEHENIYTSTD